MERFNNCKEHSERIYELKSAIYAINEIQICSYTFRFLFNVSLFYGTNHVFNYHYQNIIEKILLFEPRLHFLYFMCNIIIDTLSNYLIVNT